LATPLLTTKLYVPPPRPNLVPRPRLIERLDAGLHLGHRLTLISAPAGFGKTTLVTDWLHGADGSTPSLSVAWLSLDEEDNDPARFFTYLIAALQKIDGDIGQATQSLLGAPQPPPVESLVTMLINDIAATPTRFALVLDDYHLIHTALIHDGIEFLLAHQPPHMHLIIVARTDPPLPLPRLRVRGQMTEIRADDLRFTAQEAAAFLDRALGLPLDAEMAAALEARTEGWIAGLQLAALSMQGRTAERVADFVAAFSGSNRHVIDYLAEEVLAQQPEEIRDFLRQTAILDRLSAPLCDAVCSMGTGVTGRDDSGVMLKRLERANLFLIPLDEQHRWYRYHRLFADFLRTELERQRATGLHLKAAHWFEAHGLLPEAVRHALAYTTGSGDVDEAARIITLAGSQALFGGAFITLLSWLDALPDEIVRSRGGLASLKAWALFMTGQADAGKSYARSAEACLAEAGDPVSRGWLLSLRCYVADVREVLHLAREALDLLGDADPLSRGGTLFMLGDAQDAVGDVAGAIQTFREALDVGQRHDNPLVAATALGHLAVSMNRQGRRREALALCRRGVEQYVDARGRPLPLAGLIYVALGAIEYEANDLVPAHQHLQMGLGLGQQSAARRIVLYSLEALAQLQHAMRETETALATIQEARLLAFQANERVWIDASAAIEADLQLKQGNVLAAERWAETAHLLPTEFPDAARESEYFTVARLLLAQNRPEEAQALLARLERSALLGGRQRSLITITILRALAEQALGDEAEALDTLERALSLAASEDYRRAFLDEGLAVASLLLQLRARRGRTVAPAFVDNLLEGFAVGTKERQPEPLIEPLSEREIRVLRLMAADLSSPEIAEALVIAVSTARSHIKRIYRKLDVHSRYEAIERARALDLL
jgi:LuxR family maltose regulon positive regulatory protein